MKINQLPGCVSEVLSINCFTTLSLPSKIKAHPDLGPIGFVPDAIAQLFDQKYTPAPILGYVFRQCRVLYIFRIKSEAFIADRQRKAVVMFFNLDMYTFALTTTIAMDNGVIDGFCEANQNIGIFIL